MVCSICFTDNEAGRRFCKECGARLVTVCASCGAANTPDAKFCGDCAARLATAPPHGAPGDGDPEPGAQAAPPIAERRLVSVLFADLVGFTTLAEGRDAEDTRELLTRYFELARDVVERYGGTVEKFIGDAVMAVWGTPIAHEDDAERAVRAGLELVDAVRAIGPGIEARAGILTGEAAVTVGAVGQGMVAGDLVNTASRLQSVAAPGSVLVDESTQRAAGDGIEFEPAGDRSLKGRTLPVPAWLAVRLVSDRRGGGRAGAHEAPFVGRDDELRLLKDLFHATAREGRARLVSLFGPAGIGKTRLAWEFLKHVDGLTEPVWWHDGRSPAYGDGISFWALGEMIRSRCGLRESDDEPTTRARVAEALARHVPDPAERRWLEPALLALLGIESGAGPDQLFGAWRTFFERLAATAPVILVFEDFHFADTGLVDFVDHLLDWSRTAPIYVLTLARPELLERRPDWGNGKRSFVSLHLDPLADQEMEALLGGLVPGLPEQAQRAIVARADGIPLYAVETVRMLLAQGRIALDDGAYRPAGDIGTLSVPETLTALIGSRLDSLAPDERSLVSDAAVLGQSFTLAALAAVSGVPESGLASRMAGLVRRELLRIEVDPRSPERGSYTFVQALIREVAYNTLARRDRASRHLSAARFLEALGSDELAGALAGHYLAAHASTPPGPAADAIAAQTQVTLRAAADRASALGSPAQALAFLDQALSVTTEPGARAGLLEQVGAAAGAMGDDDRARAPLTEAIALHGERGDRAGACRATAELVRILLYGSARGEALALVEAASDEYTDLAEEPAGVALRSQLSRALFLHHRHAESIATADAVLPTLERLELLPVLADLLVTKGASLSSFGRPREGIALIDAGRRIAESEGLTLTVLRAILNGGAPIEEDDPAASMAMMGRGIELANRVGAMGELVGFVETFAFMAGRVGDWEAAIAQVDRALTLVDDRQRFHLVGTLSWFAVLRGEPIGPHLERLQELLRDDTDAWSRIHLYGLKIAAALADGDVRLAHEAVAWFDEAVPDEVDAWGQGVLARIALWNGDAPRAAAALKRVRAATRRGRALDALVAALAAGVAALDGRTDEARSGYRVGLRGFDALGLAFDAALIGLDMAIVLGPDDAEVRSAAGSARGTFVTLGAAPFVARMDAAFVRVGAIS